jgi:hypothetical protein
MSHEDTAADRARYAAFGKLQSAANAFDLKIPIPEFGGGTSVFDGPHISFCVPHRPTPLFDSGTPFRGATRTGDSSTSVQRRGNTTESPQREEICRRKNEESRARALRNVSHLSLHTTRRVGRVVGERFTEPCLTE